MCPRPWPMSRSAGWDARTRSPQPCFGSAAQRPASCSASHFPSMAATPPAEPPTTENHDHNEPLQPSVVASAASPPLPARVPGDHLALGLRCRRRERRPSYRRSRSERPGFVAESEPGLRRPRRQPLGGHADPNHLRRSVLTARLHDNATAGDLAAQLPLTLTFRDHDNVEKTVPLPRELSLEGAPEGHDPAAGDIGYWAPDGDLVFYYDSDAPFFNGIVRIGEFDG